MAKKTQNQASSPPTDDAVVTQTRVARLLGVSPRTVRDYVARGIIPSTAVAAGGRLYEIGATSAVAEHLRESAAGRKIGNATDGADSIDPVEANARLRIAQTAVAKEQLRVVRARASLLEGEQIRRPAVEAAIRAVISSTRASLQAVPIELHSLLGGLSTDDQLAVEDLIERKLIDMANQLPAAVSRTIAAELGEDEEDTDE